MTGRSPNDEMIVVVLLIFRTSEIVPNDWQNNPSSVPLGGHSYSLGNETRQITSKLYYFNVGRIVCAYRTYRYTDSMDTNNNNNNNIVLFLAI